MFAREEENEPWVELMAIRRVEWWARKQEKPVLFVNDKPYNAYRIVDLQRVRNEQATLSRVELSCVSLYNASSLEYPSLQWYDNMEIDPVVPRNGVFSFFSNSFLPSGIKLDSASGALIGKPWPAFHFQIHITAVSITNETLTVQLVGDVLKCEGNRVPIRVRIAVKDAPNEYAYQLFREESGGRVLIGSESSFARNTVYSRDYCVPRGRLSIDFISQSKSGWEAGSSYSVSMDDMVLVSGSVSESAQAPSVAREFFSTVQPATEEMAFAVSTTKEANWMLNAFDDAKWERVALKDLAMKPSFFVRSVAPLMLVENATATVRVDTKCTFDAYYDNAYVARGDSIFSVFNESPSATLAFAVSCSYPNLTHFRLSVSYSLAGHIHPLYPIVKSSALKQGKARYLLDENPETVVVPTTARSPCSLPGRRPPRTATASTRTPSRPLARRRCRGDCTVVRRCRRMIPASCWISGTTKR